MNRNQWSTLKFIILIQNPRYLTRLLFQKQLYPHS